eukprot:1100887-Rhodomonas_salina.1
MNGQVGTRIPPMQHGIKDNSAVAAQHQDNHRHDGSIGAVLLPIGDVAGQVLQAHAARPSIARPATTNLVRSVA